MLDLQEGKLAETEEKLNQLKTKYFEMSDKYR